MPKELTQDQRIHIAANFDSEKVRLIKELMEEAVTIVKVIHVETYRDGGTVVYEDIYFRRYFQWWPTKRWYNQMPFPRGNLGTNDIPPMYVKEITCKIEIVENF